MPEIDILETRRLATQQKIDAIKSQDERNKLGQFSTPMKLACELIQYAQYLLPNNTGICFLDPAIGTGSFFSSLLQIFPQSQITKAVGYEIDPLYGNEANVLWKDRGLKLHLTDFTRAIPSLPSERFNLLVCNPPYVRHHYLHKLEKQRMADLGKSITGIRLSEQAGLYAHFLLIAHQWMAENGLACWLIPGEFMDVRYGQQIKQYLLSKVTLLRVHRFDPEDMQFHDALVSSSLVWFKNTALPFNHKIEFTQGGTLLKPEHSRIVHHRELINTSKWTKLFSQQESDFIKHTPHLISLSPKQKSKELILSDFFYVKRGLATGANNYFILHPEKIAEYDIPEVFIQPVLPTPRNLRSDEILADQNGFPLLDQKLYLLTCDISEKEIKAEYPSLWQYLQVGKNQGIHRGYLCRNRKLWYSQEKRSTPMFLCAYMGRQGEKKTKPFRFILNRSIATATNAYHMLYPKPFLQKALQNNPDLIDEIWHALQAIPAEILKGESRVYGGGLHKLEPGDLGAISAHGFLEVLHNHMLPIPIFSHNPTLPIEENDDETEEQQNGRINPSLHPAAQTS
jgi:adenine-specific DNA-methyltransferase